MCVQRILLFDGVCNLCNGAVQWIIQHDPKGNIYFASLQGDNGLNIREQYQIAPDLGSLVFIDNQRAYTKSSAVCRVCKYLNGLWKIGYVGLFIPKPFRDMLYNFVASRRYRWFGKKTSCWIPTKALRKRFLD